MIFNLDKLCSKLIIIRSSCLMMQWDVILSVFIQAFWNQKQYTNAYNSNVATVCQNVIVKGLFSQIDVRVMSGILPVFQLDQLGQQELASRLTLNCMNSYVKPQSLEGIPVTVIDVRALEFNILGSIAHVYCTLQLV